MVRYQYKFFAFLTVICSSLSLAKADSTPNLNPQSAIYNEPVIKDETIEWSEPESDQSQQAHYPSNVSEQAKIGRYPRLVQLTQRDLKDTQLRSSTAFIYTVLQNTQELRIHQMGGAWNNSVYVDDKGREWVFDGNDDPVTDCLNIATSNYYHYSRQPLGHFTADILPWMIWGSCEGDVPSTVNQRIDAYMLDFKEGYTEAISRNDEFSLPKNFSFKKFGQSEAISFFLKTLDVSNFDMNAFLPDQIHDPLQQEIFFNAIENGMKDLLNN